MILGFLFAMTAGTIIGLQNIFNNKINEKAGSWSTTTLVLGLGFLSSMILGFVFEGSQLLNLEKMKLWYWFCGFLGVGVVSCIVQGIRHLGPTLAVSIILTSQIVFALIWDTIGLLGLEKVPLTPKQLLGVMLIASGVLVFKWNGKKEELKAQTMNG